MLLLTVVKLNTVAVIAWLKIIFVILATRVAALTTVAVNILPIDRTIDALDATREVTRILAIERTMLAVDATMEDLRIFVIERAIVPRLATAAVVMA